MGHKTRRLLAAAALVLGAGVAGAQTTPTMTTTSSPSALVAPAPAVEQIVAIARTVESGTPGVAAFTVPAHQQLVVTDVVITNPSTTPVCGASVSPSGTTASATTATTTTTTAGGSTVTASATSTSAVESGTGTLCVPAQTSLALSLTTGLEFAGGESVQLANQPLATTGAAAATSTTTTTTATTTAAANVSGPLFYHLRGFLVATGT
jgi:hypothetical protein